MKEGEQLREDRVQALARGGEVYSRRLIYEPRASQPWVGRSEMERGGTALMQQTRRRRWDETVVSEKTSGEVEWTCSVENVIGGSGEEL